MRSALRLLASVSRTSSTYLEPGAPTGLTGLLTHPNPRSTLLYLYSSTLEKLSALPSSSVYRQSTTALTTHRMRIVESIKPAGLSDWQTRVAPLVDAHPNAFKRIPALDGDGFNIVYHSHSPESTYRSEDDVVNAKYKRKPELEGPRDFEEVSKRGERLAHDEIGEQLSALHIEEEPPLTGAQVGEMEQKIGAGLIEEVIRVAEGEKGLVDEMREAQVWQDLEEKPAEGQWVYNERKNM